MIAILSLAQPASASSGPARRTGPLPGWRAHGGPLRLLQTFPWRTSFNGEQAAASSNPVTPTTPECMSMLVWLGTSVMARFGFRRQPPP